MWGYSSPKRTTFGAISDCLEAEIVTKMAQMAKMVIINGPLVTNGLNKWCHHSGRTKSHMWGYFSPKRTTFGAISDCLEAEIVTKIAQIANMVILNGPLVTDGLNKWSHHSDR